MTVSAFRQANGFSPLINTMPYNTGCSQALSDNTTFISAIKNIHH